MCTNKTNKEKLNDIVNGNESQTIYKAPKQFISITYLHIFILLCHLSKSGISL